MNFIKSALMSAAVLTLATAGSGAGNAQTTAPSAPVAAASHGHHPEIRRAIAALNRALAHLQSANHDFGGHRVDAINACKNAISQLQLALQYDQN